MLPRLHAVTDDRVASRPDLVERAAVLSAAAGPTLAVHLRSRALTGEAFTRAAHGLQAALGAHGSWLVVNDRADVARAVGAHAVTVGRGGLAVADVRRVVPAALVGRAVHDDDEVRTAVADGADFLVAGSVYASASHPGAPPAGPNVVRVAARTGRPVIAIGGITVERVTEVLAAGAWGVAAIRALWDADDPAAAAAAFAAALPRSDLIPVTINGEARQARRDVSLAGLLADLGLDPRAVVVEQNRRIVRRDALATAAVAAGDQIELVHFVGGG